MNRRVVMIGSQFPPVYGGAGKQAVLLARAIIGADPGVEIHIVTLNQCFAPARDVQAGLHFRRAGRRIRYDTRIGRVFGTLLLSLVCAVEIFRLRPAAVHIHGAYWWSVVAAISGRIARSRVVLKTTRDGEDDAETVRKKRLGPIPVGVIYGLSFRLAHTIVALTPASRDVSGAAGYGDRTVLLPNGIDLASLHRTPERRRDARLKNQVALGTEVAIFVGYLAPHKGILDLLAAWQRIGQHANRELWLVGPSAGFYRELDPLLVSSAITAARNTQTTVREFGLLSPEQVLELYWAADVFALPSYAEGMPNSLLEAAAAGCTLVVSRISGIVDVVDETNATFIFPGAVEDLASALDSSLRDPSPVNPTDMMKFDVSSLSTQYLKFYGLT